MFLNVVPGSTHLTITPPGRIRATMDGQESTLQVEKGEATDGTQFDRFGLITTWIDGNGQQIYFDDLSYSCR